MPDVSAEFVGSSLTLLRRLLERSLELEAEPDSSASVRADVAVKTLAFLRAERDVCRASDGACDDESSERSLNWRARVQARFDAARQAIDAVEADDERSYLRRLLLEEALATSSCDGEFFLETLVDETLEQIDDSDERQNALYPYALFLARRLARRPDELEQTRAKISRLLDELDDLYEFERALVEFGLNSFAARVQLGVELSQALALLDEDLEEAETEEIYLQTCDETLDALCAASPEFARVAPRETFYRRLKERAETLERILESGVYVGGARDGDELDDDELDELRELARYLVVRAPQALEDLTFWLGYAERRQAFDLLERSINMTASGSDARARLFDLAERMARSSASGQVRAERLTRLARLEFQFGDAEKGKNAVRETLALLAKSDDVAKSVALYRELIETHEALGKRKPAGKLAELLLTEIERVDADVMRDHLLNDSFPIFMRLLTPERLDDALDAFDSERWQSCQRNCVAFDDAWKRWNGGEQEALSDISALADQAIEGTRDDDPVVAVDSLSHLAQFVKERVTNALRNN